MENFYSAKDTAKKWKDKKKKNEKTPGANALNHMSNNKCVTQHEKYKQLKKWAIGSEQIFTKEVIQVVNKHMKRQALPAIIFPWCSNDDFYFFIPSIFINSNALRFFVYF